MSTADIDRRFTHHPPKDEGDEYFYVAMRQLGRSMAHFIDHNTSGRECSLALTKIEEAVMWANAARARNGGPDPREEDSA